MFLGYSPITQALLGTLFTWGLTAAGAAMVFLFNGFKRTFYDASLGFAAGVMTAASFWSLILPALDITAQTYGDENKFLSIFPVIVGIGLGALFVFATDALIPDDFIKMVISDQTSDDDGLEKQHIGGYKMEDEDIMISSEFSLRQRGAGGGGGGESNMPKSNTSSSITLTDNMSYNNKMSNKNAKFKKIVLLIMAVTVHNIPEGMAVGVAFGAIGSGKSATFASARNLAYGIGIQNFPEGLAVSLPLYASGFSYWRSFWYGQLSGMVEPIAGLLGALGVQYAQPALPYALAFAAGAMLYVVFENLMPEASSHGNSKLSTWFCMIGFCIMMSLDVGLG